MSGRVKFTSTQVENFTCPPDKKQAFLWDTDVPQLGLRSTPNGKPAYIFQGRFKGATPRITIGSPSDWSIKDARSKAREFQRHIDEGRDPRVVKQENEAKEEARVESINKGKLNGLTVWETYIKDRKLNWGDRSLADHLRMTKVGGKERNNRKDSLTRDGILRALLDRKLSDLTETLVLDWARKEIKRGATQARLGFRLLRAFINWCDGEKQYKGIIDMDIPKSKKIKEILGSPKAKSDYLQKEQLKPWMKRVRQLQNSITSAYYQALLITGARPSEMRLLKWEDVDFQWGSMRIGDKIEDSRVIPLTPYLSSLLQRLPRRNQWVFSSPTSESGYIAKPAKTLNLIIKDAGVPHVSMHGLRRSFKSLTEWLEIPVGVVAQIMGHKPSATAEKHYTERPLDLLRMHHTKIEAWMLAQAEIDFKPEDSAQLRLVK